MNWDESTETRFQQKILEDSSRALHVAYCVFIPFFAAFVVADFFIFSPDLFFKATAVRILTIGAMLPGYLRSRKPQAPIWAYYGLLGPVMAAVTVIPLLTNGYKSPYFFGLSLVILS